MKGRSFNDGWAFRQIPQGVETVEGYTEVALPHDAMIGEERSERAASVHNSGWFEGRDYEYVKRWTPDADLEGEVLILEFEGVYRMAEVFLDGTLATRRPYGYTNFFVNLGGLVHPGRECELRVVAHNADQPNSRWYSGAGIYRPVTLWTGPAQHLLPGGIGVKTVSLGEDVARIEVSLEATAAGSAVAEIVPEDEGRPLACSAFAVDEGGRGHVAIDIRDPRPWAPDHPALYRCRVTYRSIQGDTDEDCVTFGIRTLSWGADGLLLNGARIVLKGACIHHDNGVLGACAFEDAELRKVLLMKEQGYNALRSAHNPCSKALLDACDRLGILMMDEYVDHWYIRKTLYDYVTHFDAWWRRDLDDMVRKDRNHPSVVLYSIGNEVSETAEERGVKLTRDMAEHLHALDSTRPVTCGVNIFFNLLSSLGLGQYSDEKARREAEEHERASTRGRHRSVGSEFYNRLAGLVGAGFMKRAATLPLCDAVTRDAFAQMDIAGYNYGIERYERDLKAYPDRLILGSETFCADAYRFSRLAEQHPRLIGDFVWAGMDYLGEAGIGSWEYEDYAGALGGFGWLTAGSGRIDLTGKPLGEALFTRVALGGETGPFIAVRPVNHTGERHTPSAWKLSDALESWSWDGCEGRAANVEIYARAHAVALILNGCEVARRRMRGSCIARVCCIYEPGTLEAVAFDEDGREISRCALASSSGPVELRAEVEYAGTPVGFARRDVWHDGPPAAPLAVGAGRLAFVRVRYTGSEGTTRPLERGRLRAAVEGGELLGFGCAAPFNAGSFVTGETETYYGEALAVVRAPVCGSGELRLQVTDGLLEAVTAIPVV